MLSVFSIPCLGPTQCVNYHFQLQTSPYSNPRVLPLMEPNCDLVSVVHNTKCFLTPLFHLAADTLVKLGHTHLMFHLLFSNKSKIEKDAKQRAVSCEKACAPAVWTYHGHLAPRHGVAPASCWRDQGAGEERSHTSALCRCCEGAHRCINPTDPAHKYPETPQKYTPCVPYTDAMFEETYDGRKSPKRS